MLYHALFFLHFNFKYLSIFSFFCGFFFYLFFFLFKAWVISAPRMPTVFWWTGQVVTLQLVDVIARRHIFNPELPVLLKVCIS